MEYKIPAATRIGHVHLKVSNLQRALDFYCGILCFELVSTYGDDAASFQLVAIITISGLIPGTVKMHPLPRFTLPVYSTPRSSSPPEKI